MLVASKILPSFKNLKCGCAVEQMEDSSGTEGTLVLDYQQVIVCER